MKRRNILVLLIVLSLILLGCAVSDAVQKVAEPIDKAGCEWDCERAGMTFWQYGYETNRCECKDAEGNIVVLYETFPPQGE